MGWSINYVIINGSSVDPNKFLADLMSQKSEKKDEPIPDDDGKGTSV